MKLKNPLLVVTDIHPFVEFYERVLGLRVMMDFGANKTLTGGLCLQTLASWTGFIGTDAISFGANHAEVYFEADKHIVEVGENMEMVCRRFLNSGMTPEQTAARMDVPLEYVAACM